MLWRWAAGRAYVKKTELWGAGVVICLERCADLHMAQLMPLPLTVSCFSKIQIGFTFMVPAHLGIPGQRAVKRVCVCMFQFFSALTFSSRFAAKYLLKIPPHVICVATLPCETVMSDNERQSQTVEVINDKLRGKVVTCLRCGGIINNRIKKRLLLNPLVKRFFLNQWMFGKVMGKRSVVSCTIFFNIQQWGCQAHKVYETTTFLLVTLPNSHRFYFFHWQTRQ